MPDQELNAPPHNGRAAASDAITFDESRRIDDGEWDAFVARHPSGDILQTSLWAQVKSGAGWSPIRLVARRGDTIVGGVQVLSKRPVPGVRVGAVLRGPLSVDNDAALGELMLTRLRQLCKNRSLHFLLVQLPYIETAPAAQSGLPDVFHSTVFDYMVPEATTAVDLSPEPDAILSQMHTKTRYNIRLGMRKGITVREGTRSELGLFHSFLRNTGERQGFEPQDTAYFEHMWDILAGKGHLKIFFAELDGEALSAVLVTMFGNRVIYKRGGWSGQQGNLHPNEVLHWQVMNWARSAGYRYYDFDGIDPEAAHAVTQGEPLPREALSSVTRFKLNFGGDVMILPKLYEYVQNPLLRWGSDQILPRIIRIPIVGDLMAGLDRA